MSFEFAEEINNKKGIEKKDDINYNISHTHSDMMLVVDNGSHRSNTLRFKKETNKEI